MYCWGSLWFAVPLLSDLTLLGCRLDWSVFFSYFCSELWPSKSERPLSVLCDVALKHSILCQGTTLGIRNCTPVLCPQEVSWLVEGTKLLRQDSKPPFCGRIWSRTKSLPSDHVLRFWGDRRWALWVVPAGESWATGFLRKMGPHGPHGEVRSWWCTRRKSEFLG